jgi:hypothetical protein
VALLAIALALSVMLLAVTGYLAVVGTLGVFTRASYVTCPRCGHHCLATGRPHANGCPSTLGSRVISLVRPRIHLPRN